jgi:hypothetical protein
MTVPVKTFFLCLLLLASACASGGGDHASPLAADRRITDSYAAWRPLLVAELSQAGWRPEAQDIYKFLHQGVLGPAHAIEDTMAARAWLHREWEAARDLPLDGRPLMLKPLRPDGRLVRVDLVRLRHHIVTRTDSVKCDETAVLDTLLACFIETADRWPQDPSLLEELWAAVRADTALWTGCFGASDMARLHAAVSVDWRSVRHSEVYRHKSRPHYRVVQRDLLPRWWRLTKGGS